MSQYPSPEQEDLLSSSSSNKSLEDLSKELQLQQERLLELKRQQEEVERRKRELEELNKRRTELSLGRKSMREKLTRAITVLERAEYEARREIEQIAITRQTFADHLADVEAIDPSAWQPEDIDDNLTKSLSKIDHAHAIYNQSRAKIDALSGQDITGEEGGESSGSSEGGEAVDIPFSEMVRRGFAFTLPLIIFLGAAIFMFFLLK